MRERRNEFKGLSVAYAILNACLVWIAYHLSVWLRINVLHGTDNADMTGTVMSLSVFLYGIVLSAVVALLVDDRYLDDQRSDQNFTTIFFVNLIGVLLLVVLLFLYHIVDFSRVALFLFWAISTALLEGGYALQRYLLIRYWDRIVPRKRIVVVGNGEAAKRYMEAVGQQNLPVSEIEGYVGLEKEGLGTCLGAYEDLNGILEKVNPDQMVVALESHETEFMESVLRAAEKEGIEVHLIPFFNEYYPKHPTVETVGDINLVNLRSTPLNNGWNGLMKRTVDLVGSFLLIILTSPLMLIAAVGVKLSSPGPIFFSQDRVGKDKKPFKMLKFRSMRVNAEQDSAWSTDSDPRRTAFGTFIRKYSIDELPQLFNVFMGDMSLVGPRPEIPFYVRQFKETVPLYLVRQQVRPGMTGWAQVHGLRGDTSIEERVKYDIWYIENWSLMLDIRILFMTAFGGFINNEH